MEEDCGGGQGLSWAVEPRRERERERDEYFTRKVTENKPCTLLYTRFQKISAHRTTVDCVELLATE
jgi:hypothetical protein